MKTIAIGADVGGSHISCAACDLTEKAFVPGTFSESKVDNQAGADEILEEWARTLKTSMNAVGLENVAGIGFAMPGPFDYLHGVALFKGNNKKYEQLYGVNIADRLRHTLGLANDFPIRFINDATAFALGEDWMGKARGSQKSLCITLGTGFGSAFISHHLPVATGDEVPSTGAVWHLPFQGGNADDYFSTRGLLQRYFTKTGIQLDGVKALAMRMPEDAEAAGVFRDFGRQLGIFLSPWVQKFGVEVLVMGGNISHASSYFMDALRQSFAENNIHIGIEVSELKESASITGGAVLADDDFYNLVLPVLAHM